MPLPAVWGPRAWEILHGIGWKAGRSPISHLAIDEKREMMWLLQHIEYIIPCPECKAHVQSYRKREGLPSESNEVGSWLWTFHEAVNERLGKGDGPPFTHTLGENKPLQKLLKEYILCVQESFLLGHLRAEQVKEWNRHFQLWFVCF